MATYIGEPVRSSPRSRKPHRLRRGQAKDDLATTGVTYREMAMALRLAQAEAARSPLP